MDSNYSGDFRNDKREGTGKMSYPNGDVYVFSTFALKLSLFSLSVVCPQTLSLSLYIYIYICLP